MTDRVPKFNSPKLNQQCSCKRPKNVHAKRIYFTVICRDESIKNDLLILNYISITLITGYNQKTFPDVIIWWPCLFLYFIDIKDKLGQDIFYQHCQIDLNSLLNIRPIEIIFGVVMMDDGRLVMIEAPHGGGPSNHIITIFLPI